MPSDPADASWIVPLAPMVTNYEEKLELGKAQQKNDNLGGKVKT